MVDDANDDENTAPQSTVNVNELLAKCHDLLDELEDFQKFLVEQKKEHVVEIRQFRNSVASELKSLERVCITPPNKTISMLTSHPAVGRRPHRRTHNPHPPLL